MPLSEQDLLLLCCFLYSDLTPRSGNGDSLKDMVEEFVDPKTGEVSLERIKNSGIQFSGDLDAASFKKVLEDMRKSDALMNLKLMKTSPEYEGSIRAACFVDANTGKATVAFRGTGGSYQQWYNNFEGYGDLSQETQDAAAAFIMSLTYNDIDVTGQSNGGDQAMYVSIVCADKISRCVSYEGQGFSKEFTGTYAEEIERNKDKIKNICAKKDFVSALLFNIAGETVYVPSDSDLLGGTFSHGAYGLYTANKETLEKNGGNFPESAYVEQILYCKAIHILTVYLSEHSDSPFTGPAIELFADVAGILVGLIINKNWKNPMNLLRAFDDLIIAIRDFEISELKDCIAAIREIRNRVMNWIINKVSSVGDYASANPQITVDTYKLRNYAQRLQTANRRIATLDARLDSLYWRVGLLGLWDLMQADLMTGYSWRLLRAASYLNDTASDFDAIEKELMSAL